MDKNTKPVKVSSGAFAALSYKMRQWSGWSTGRLVLGDTETGSPWAACSHPDHQIILNPDNLLLNPNRVLNTVTPFRLRQEALLTGALLHEAGHARHSHWQPGRYGNPDPAVHGPAYNGQPVSDLTLEFAKTLEEARVEGLVAAEATTIGAHGLAWTLNCSAMMVLPLTEVSTDMDQAILQMVESWVLRAGRQIAVAHQVVSSGGTYVMPEWVKDFNALVGNMVKEQIKRNMESGIDTDDPAFWAGVDPSANTTAVVTHLYEAVTAGTEADAPGSTFMVDQAKAILDLLFPEQEQQDSVSAESGCPGEAGEGDEDGSEGGQGDDQDSDEAEDQPEGDEPGDGDSDGDSDDADGDAEGDDDSEQEGDDSDEVSDQSDSDKEMTPNQREVKQAALSKVEKASVQAAAKERKDEQTKPSAGPDPTGQVGQNGEPSQGEADQPDASDPSDPAGASGGPGRGWEGREFRAPTGDERDVRKGAEGFLRNIIDPSESGKQQVTDSPSAHVDGAALSAWKAGGQTTAPRFFRRTKRTDQPAPPVKIAILVDRSYSMDNLDKPSSLLSWALAAACIDLRNFAGRGVQVQSTLIHWGNTARVVQPNGVMLPGIPVGKCAEGTRAMDDALDLVAQEMPGFFEPAAKPVNRLLVQFTDWELSYHGLPQIDAKINKALTNGVNMLSVVPMDYSWRSTSLDPIIQGIRNPTGRNALLKYNPSRPQEVWTAAAQVLSGGDTDYGF